MIIFFTYPVSVHEEFVMRLCLCQIEWEIGSIFSGGRIIAPVVKCTVLSN